MRVGFRILAFILLIIVLFSGCVNTNSSNSIELKTCFNEVQKFLNKLGHPNVEFRPFYKSRYIDASYFFKFAMTDDLLKKTIKIDEKSLKDKYEAELIRKQNYKSKYILINGELFYHSYNTIVDVLNNEMVIIKVKFPKDHYTFLLDINDNCRILNWYDFNF